MSEATYWRLDGKIIVDSEKKFIKCTRCPCIPNISSSSSSRTCVPGSIKESVLISIYYAVADLYEDADGNSHFTNCRLGDKLDESYTFTLDPNSELSVREVKDHGCVTGGTYVHTCTYWDKQFKSYLYLEFTESGDLYDYGFGDDGCGLSLLSMGSFPFTVTSNPDDELCTLYDMGLYAYTVT